MAVRENDVTPAHFEWLVEGRSANQRATLDLYRLIVDYEAILNGNVIFNVAAQELTGIVFSLWRAVFLSDTTGEYADQLADLRKFLASLISDNSVQYNTDKNSRNWSFRYYVSNAMSRLEGLSKDSLQLITQGDLEASESREKQEWIVAHALTTRAIKRFAEILAAEKAK